MALQKVDLDTPQPGGRFGDPTRTAWRKHNENLDEIESLVSGAEQSGAAAVARVVELEDSLGDAAYVPAAAFASASQGAKAESAVQPDQLAAAAGELQVQLDTIASAQQAGAIAESTWARLISVEPGLSVAIGGAADIPPETDGGSHVDPIKAGGQVVPNAGRFVRRTSAANGWEWLSANTLASKADTAFVAQETQATRRPLQDMVAVAPFNGAVPLGLVNDDGSFPVGVEVATGNLLARIPVNNPGLVASLNNRFAQIDPDGRLFLYDGPGPWVPLIINEQRQIIDAINIETGERFGSASQAGTAYASAPLRDLAAAAVPALADWVHILLYGQSLSIGATALPPLSTSSRYSHLTFQAGPRATKAGSTGDNPGTGAAVPLFENAVSGDGQNNRGETPASGLANAFTTHAAVEQGIAPAERVLFVSAPGHGGYRLDQLDMASSWIQVLKDHVTEAKALADAAGKTYVVGAIPWIQGEADSNTTFAAYRAAMVSFRMGLCTWIRGITGQAFDPLFITYQTPNNGALDGQISQAQLDLAMNEPGFAFGGPIYHLHSTDGTHVDNVGSYRMGWALGRAVKQYLIDKKAPAFIRPLAAVRTGRRISWRFEVPQAPLVLDLSGLPPTQDYGFRVNDASGVALPVDSVAIENGDTVVVTLVGDGATAAQVRYSLDYLGTGTTWNDEETGNLRDSTPGRCEVAGNSYPAWHVAPSCRATIINLGA
ncbi:hypothetical protein [Stenotrophomonas chelatiphaga]|uniref:hypothetical protein n=1 Tax=Stenotrophomonas chelatiphaga TaxID=517011 RepID=UPI002897F434|nr:hypothetical protein [Stenotrophomonas chelatiphaga]